MAKNKKKKMSLSESFAQEYKKDYTYSQEYDYAKDKLKHEVASDLAIQSEDVSKVASEDVSCKDNSINDNNNSKNNAKAVKLGTKGSVIQFLKFLLCAASAGLIQFGTFTILTFSIPDTLGTIVFINKMSTQVFISTTVALGLSILWNFTFNRKFTFKSAGNVPRAMILAFLFYLPFYPFQTWYVGAVSHAIAPDAEWAKLIAEGTVMVINFVLEFLWQKFVIYRKEENTAVSRKEKKAEKKDSSLEIEDNVAENIDKITENKK